MVVVVVVVAAAAIVSSSGGGSSSSSSSSSSTVAVAVAVAVAGAAAAAAVAAASVYRSPDSPPAPSHCPDLLLVSPLSLLARRPAVLCPRDSVTHHACRRMPCEFGLSAVSLTIDMCSVLEGVVVVFRLFIRELFANCLQGSFQGLEAPLVTQLSTDNLS